MGCLWGASLAVAGEDAVERLPAHPNPPSSMFQHDFAPASHALDDEATRRLESVADAVVEKLVSGVNVGVTIQASSDKARYSGGNGNLAMLRAGEVTRIFEAALRAKMGSQVGDALDPASWIRQQIVTGRPLGERFVRIWIYEDGYRSSPAPEIPPVVLPDSVVTLAELESRLAQLVPAAEPPAPRAFDPVSVELAMGGGWVNLLDAGGPELAAEVQLTLSPERSFYLSGGGAVGRLESAALWRVGGGLGYRWSELDLSLGYRRMLYAPHQLEELDGGISQAFDAHAHTLRLRAALRVREPLWVGIEGLMGQGYRMEDGIARREAVAGLALQLAVRY